MNTDSTHFDVVVVGGGHAGIEAAYAAARMGSKTALITLDLNAIGTMPCNPAIGGIGKGHLVFEISALGGLMPKLCSKTYLQARMLNTRKGPAVQGLRLQIDKHAYSKLSQQMLKKTPNLSLMSATVDDILLDEQGAICGVKLNDESIINTTAVVITTGTFLNGKIHIGQQQFDGGRRGEKAVTTLAHFFRTSGLQIGRLKTGTPPRLLHSSIDYTQMECQEADDLAYLFEFQPHKVTNTHACYITHTNEKTHEIIHKNLDRSAMYSGNIEGVGPRYCPSIEDKISRFANKSSHHVFVEPEDASMTEVYPNGISTSLPADVQEDYIRSIKGFEHAIITKLGYAIEYDFVHPNQLNHTLEVKKFPGLYLAGQINGTTGYEEAGAQGLIAGINAHLKIAKKNPLILDRTESYIGVMIDDLINMGIDEPYRMFTSRAERRLLLRQDNAFLRLTDKAHQLGLIDEQFYADFCKERDVIDKTIETFKTNFKSHELLAFFGSGKCPKDIIKTHAPTTISERAMLTVQATFMYEPYLKREEKEVARRKQYQTLPIPKELQIGDLPGLSKELQEKMQRYRPTTIADAALIPGMTPAAISLLIFKIRDLSKNIRRRDF